jgi:hypothetical protein
MVAMEAKTKMSPTRARRPPQGPARTSTQPMRRTSWAQSILAPAGFTTPSPRLVRGPFGAAGSLARPRFDVGERGGARTRPSKGGPC